MTESGSRFNDGKAPLSMILEANHALQGCAEVLAFGAKKYARGNWHKGLSHTEICDSLLRHLSAYLSGEDNDPESNLKHVNHVLCNAIFLAQMVVSKPELDDRAEELKSNHEAQSQ
ncbi:MAG TPA: hypothetical protein EYN67_18085 [Flavobacteriales bacterium]|nr:hypothetical protein [Methylococcaceae bacterium]HHZ97404.1 hypothetical protein [Flavobacteriales bacterium]